MFRWYRWRTWALGMVIFTSTGLLMFARFRLDALARGGAGPALPTLVDELSAGWGVAALFPWVVHFARRHPLDRAGWLRRLPLHLANVVLVSALHTTWNRGWREALYPAFGLGDYHYGHLPTRYLMELPTDLLWYGVVVGFVHLFDHYRAARERQVRIAQLEAGLARAQLQNLQAQLNPHFLFNALNTVSSVMYDDVARADEVLSRLSELLRRALATSQRQQVTLAEELEVLELYLSVMRARFADRLDVRVSADAGARDALVPTLLLQPLVENAVLHGASPPPTPTRVRVEASVEGAELVLRVDDHGPGVREGEVPVGKGIGLTSAVERLRGLYGDAAGLSLRNRVGGGLRVEVRLPVRREALAGMGTEDGRRDGWGEG